MTKYYNAIVINERGLFCWTNRRTKKLTFSKPFLSQISSPKPNKIYTIWKWNFKLSGESKNLKIVNSAEKLVGAMTTKSKFLNFFESFSSLAGSLPWAAVSEATSIKSEDLCGIPLHQSSTFLDPPPKTPNEKTQINLKGIWSSRLQDVT